MEWKALFYGEKCINKNAFHQKINPISIGKVEIKRIILFNEISYSNKRLFNYYIGYMHEGKVFSITFIHKTSANNWIF